MIKIHSQFAECLLTDGLTPLRFLEKQVQARLQCRFPHIQQKRQRIRKGHFTPARKRIFSKPRRIKG